MIDKNVTGQILGCLMKHPQFLSEIDKYNFLLTDFPSRFEKYIFSAINGLYTGGAPKIQIVDIENYLAMDTAAKSNFDSKNGVEYLQDIIDLAEVENFQYYYNKMKKLNLLKDLKNSGYDISNFYMEDLTNPKAIEINRKFEDLTIKDITDGLRHDVVKLEQKYTEKDENELRKATDGIEELLENSNAGYDVGLPIQGHILNMIIGGARLGTLTVRSSGSGVGKTRSAVADACQLAYPIRYNTTRCKWEPNGSSEKVLLIITEQSFEEIQKMILAYLTGENQQKLRYGDLSETDLNVFQTAIKVMKQYEDNLIILKMPEPTVSGIKASVRENCITNNIKYVFMDYIFVNPSLLNEFRDFHLRNDEALLFLTTALKDLASELDICVFTSTQVNAKGDDNKNIKNESAIAGSRAIINKCDNGMIMARPTVEELDVIQNIEKNSFQIPNLVTDIYKNREGQYTNIRIWSYFDLGTLRKEDLFVTDARLEAIDGFYESPDIEIVNFDDDNYESIKRFLEEIND